MIRVANPEPYFLFAKFAVLIWLQWIFELYRRSSQYLEKKKSAQPDDRWRKSYVFRHLDSHWQNFNVISCLLGMVFISRVHGDTKERSTAFARAYIGVGIGSMGEVLFSFTWFSIQEIIGHKCFTVTILNILNFFMETFKFI